VAWRIFAAGPRFLQCRIRQFICYHGKRWAQHLPLAAGGFRQAIAQASPHL
jgi:hypothetical protein